MPKKKTLEKIVLGQEIIRPICDALGVEYNRTFEINIHIPCDDLPYAEIHRWVDVRLGQIDWTMARRDPKSGWPSNTELLTMLG